MGFTSLILFGSIVGVLSTILSSRGRTGLLGAMLIGSVGALSGSFIANMLFEVQTGALSRTLILMLTLASTLGLVFLRKSINIR